MGVSVRIWCLLGEAMDLAWTRHRKSGLPTTWITHRGSGENVFFRAAFSSYTHGLGGGNGTAAGRRCAHGGHARRPGRLRTVRPGHPERDQARLGHGEF